jgi:hypothetical protein
MTTPANAAQTAIAWAATNKATCAVPAHILRRQPLAKLQTLAAPSGVLVTLQNNQILFTYDTPRNPQSDL